MPKLIRLISGAEDTADFSNFFQEDIRLKKNSRVALQSISIQLDDKNIIVDDNNRFFQIQVIGPQVSRNPPLLNPLHRVSLQKGNYNSDTFILEINRAINAALVWTDRQGVFDEFQCVWTQQQSGKGQLLNIQWNCVSNDTDDSIAVATKQVELLGDTITKTGADANWDYLYTDIAFSRGVGYFIATVSNANNQMDGLCMGLIANVPQSNVTSLEPGDYAFAVYSEGGRYHIVNKGNDLRTTYVPQDGDIIQFTLSEGVITASISNRAAPIIFGTFAYNYPDIFHGAISMYSTGNTMTDPSFTPSPYMSNSVSGVSYHTLNEELTSANYASSNLGAKPSTKSTAHAMILPPSTQKLLGFGRTNYSLVLNTGSFLASNPMIDDAIPSSLIIECPSLHLNSYDGAGHRRRNILAIVPALDTQGNNQFYMPSYPIYIDLHNADEQIFNNIQVRVLDNNDYPVPINPDSGCTLALLIDSD